jgi:hypothetical protein
MCTEVGPGCAADQSAGLDQETCHLVMQQRDGEGMNSQPVQNQSHDFLVTLAAYAALASASVVAVRAILGPTLNAKLSDPSNHELAPAYQWIDALTYVAIWGLLFVVAVGLFRIARPWPISSKAGLVIAGLGAALLVLNQLVVAATNKYFISPYVTEVGRLAIAIWLLLVNSDLRQRGVLSKGLTLLGIVFGIELAIVTVEQWLRVTTPFGGRAGSLAVTVGGLFVWQIWLGVTLLRLQPIEPSAVLSLMTGPKSQTSSKSLTDRLNSIRIPRWLGWLAIPVGALLGALGWWMSLR